MAVKDFEKDIKINRALDEKSESDFIGDDIDISEEDLRNEALQLIAMADSNKAKPKKKKKQGKEKPSSAEKRERIREVIEVSNRGFTFTEVVDYGVKRWSVSKRTMERYISEARKVEAIPEKDLRNYRADAVSRCLYIYKLSIKQKNSGTALQAQKEISKLLGLYPDQILQVQDNTENPVKALMDEISKGGLTEDDIIDGVIEVEN